MKKLLQKKFNKYIELKEAYNGLEKVVIIEPEVPTEPDDSNKPLVPDDSNQSENFNTNKDSVSTSDNSVVGLYGGLSIVALAGIYALKRKREM